MERKPWLIPGLLAIALTAAPARLNADDRLFTVTVSSPQPDIVADQPVTAWRSVPGQAIPEHGGEAKFDAQGRCTMQLSAGVYRFEVLAQPTPGRLLAICSPSTRIARSGVEATLRPANEHTIDLRMNGEPIPVGDLALRSIGPTRIMRWDRHGPPTPTIVAPQDADLTIGVIGNKDDQHVALWLERSATHAITIDTQSLRLHRCRLAIDPDTPPLSGATASLMFPDTTVTVDVVNGVTLLTNRRVLELKYRLDGADGKCLITRPALYELNEQTEWHLGGRLTCASWGVVLTKFGKPTENHLVLGAGLVDAEGREIDNKASSLDLLILNTYRDGSALPTNPLSAEEQNKLGDPMQSLICKIAWTWGDRHEQDTNLAPLTPLQSPHFTLRVPPGWTHRGIIYLVALERTRAILSQVTHKDGPDHHDIRWRRNVRMAVARVGGKNSWMSMPFRQLERSDDVFDLPQLIVHEMLHNYGYRHGPAMNRDTQLAKTILQQHRWMSFARPDDSLPTIRGPRQ